MVNKKEPTIRRHLLLSEDDLICFFFFSDFAREECAQVHDETPQSHTAFLFNTFEISFLLQCVILNASVFSLLLWHFELKCGPAHSNIECHPHNIISPFSNYISFVNNNEYELPADSSKIMLSKQIQSFQGWNPRQIAVSLQLTLCSRLDVESQFSEKLKYPPIKFQYPSVIVQQVRGQNGLSKETESAANL